MGRFADRRVHAPRASPMRRALCSQAATLPDEDRSLPTWSRCRGDGSSHARPGAFFCDYRKAKSTLSNESTGLEKVWARIALWLHSFAALLAWRTGGRQCQGLMEEITWITRVQAHQPQHTIGRG